MDAVEKAVNCLEDNPNFNAGHGAVLNEIGQVECDAMIMDGSTMNSGTSQSLLILLRAMFISYKFPGDY